MDLSRQSARVDSMIAEARRTARQAAPVRRALVESRRRKRWERLIVTASVVSVAVAIVIAGVQAGG